MICNLVGMFNTLACMMIYIICERYFRGILILDSLWHTLNWRTYLNWHVSYNLACNTAPVFSAVGDALISCSAALVLPSLMLLFW